MKTKRIFLKSIENFYEAIQNRINLSSEFLSFLIGMVGFYIVHASYFIERHVNEDYRHYITDLAGNAQVFFSGSRISLGRFLGGFTVYCNSWTIGFICALLLSLTCVVIIKLFEVKNKINAALISLAVVSFPSLACTYGYLTMAQNVSIAIFCAVMSVYLTKRYKFGFIIGSILLMISLAEYQAYIALSVVLSLMMVFVYLINEKSINKSFFIYLLRYLLMGILGVILYLIILKLILKFNNGSLANYRGVESMGKIPLLELPKLISNSYSNFIKFFKGRIYFYFPSFVKWFYIVIAIGSINTIFEYIKIKNIKIKIAALIFIIIFPLSVDIIEIIAPESGLDAISSYVFVMCIIVPLGMLEYSKSNCLKLITGVLTLGILTCNYSSISRYYLFLDSVYEQTAFFENRLYARIEETEGFEYGMPVAIISGKDAPINNTNYNNDTEFPELRGERGIFTKYIGLSQTDARNSQKTVNLFQVMLGADVSIADSNAIEEIKNTEEYRNMGIYPDKDGIKVINGVMVVNFVDHSIGPDLLTDDFDIFAEENIVTITNNYSFGDFEYAWYIYNDGQAIDKIMYSDNNSLEYTFEADGNYSVKAFIMDKSNNDNRKSVIVSDFTVKDGIVSIK